MKNGFRYQFYHVFLLLMREKKGIFINEVGKKSGIFGTWRIFDIFEERRE
jgi:hypothetical protein